MRSLALTLAVVFATASSGLARQLAEPERAPVTQVTYDLSAKAAGIDVMAKSAVSDPTATPKRDAEEESAATQNRGRSFWKSPWPYVIAGAVVVVVVVAASAGDGGIY